MEGVTVTQVSGGGDGNGQERREAEQGCVVEGRKDARFDFDVEQVEGGFHPRKGLNATKEVSGPVVKRRLVPMCCQPHL